MLTFYAALFFYCWSIPKHGSRITIASVSGVLFTFFLVWVCTVWLGGLPSPIVCALRALRLSRLRHAVVSCRKLFRSHPTNDVGSEHELAGGVVGGGV